MKLSTTIIFVLIQLLAITAAAEEDCSCWMGSASSKTCIDNSDDYSALCSIPLLTYISAAVILVIFITLFTVDWVKYRHVVSFDDEVNL